MVEDSRRFSRYFKSKTVFEKYDFKNRKVDATRLAVHEKRVHVSFIQAQLKLIIKSEDQHLNGYCKTG